MNSSSAAGAALAGVRRLCAALPEVTEGQTHGAPTWFVRRRSFVEFIDPGSIDPGKYRVDEPHVALWAAAPPGARPELVAADPDRFFVPRFGGYAWVGVRLDVERGGPRLGRGG